MEEDYNNLPYSGIDDYIFEIADHYKRLTNLNLKDDELEKEMKELEHYNSDTSFYLLTLAKDLDDEELEAIVESSFLLN